VAVAELHGAEAGLAAIAELAEVLDGYQPFHATRAELLARLGHPDAAAAYDRAIELSTNATERRFLEGRRAEVSR
jgi:RNA polymerase sigma-70 factor (ECF subfamily)